MMLEEIVLHRLKIPLKVPYKLAIALIEAYDTILVEVRDAEGRVGLGEATIVTGYTGETIEGSWRAAGAAAARMAGREPAEAKREADALRKTHPFAATALATAVEMLEGHSLLRVERRESVPLLALVGKTAPAEIEAEIERLLGAGFGTLKVKVGFDLERDLERSRLIQKLVAGRAKIRIDANQGYTRGEGIRFATALAPEGIELLEQTCPAGDWESAAAVAAVSNLPMMLDESIYGIEDIERAAALRAARFIKLKLMKMGGLDRLVRGLERIRACGMTPVLGNGAAGEIACWMEACVARRHIDNAGEFNGWLKAAHGILGRPIAAEGGALVLDPARPPALDRGAVSARAQETVRFPAAKAGADAREPARAG